MLLIFFCLKAEKYFSRSLKSQRLILTISGEELKY